MEFPVNGPPPLTVRVTQVNRHEHIDSIVRHVCSPVRVDIDFGFLQKRQRGGIGSAAHDPNQKDIRAFFGGGTVETPVEAAEHSESNARDEVVA